MFKKKQKQIKPQGPWLVTLYSEIQNKGQKDEFDPGYIEFEHPQTKLSIKEEIAWIKGQGSFKGKPTPTLIDIWNMFLRHTPGTSLFVFKNWHIEREPGCFVCNLADRVHSQYVLKRIVSNFTCQEQDFAAFIEMLDNEQKYFDDSRQSTVFDLDLARLKREA